MLPLSGISNDLPSDFPEVHAARKAQREYVACIILVIMLPIVLFGLFALLN